MNMCTVNSTDNSTDCKDLRHNLNFKGFFVDMVISQVNSSVTSMTDFTHSLSGCSVHT